MKKPAAPAQGTKFTEKDAERLIASCGQAPAPEKKAALLARLGAERAAFEKAPVPISPKNAGRGHTRD